MQNAKCEIKVGDVPDDPDENRENSPRLLPWGVLFLKGVKEVSTNENELSN